MQPTPPDNTPTIPPAIVKREIKAHKEKRTRISSEQWEILIELVRKGNFIHVSAMQAGVNVGTVYNLRSNYARGKIRNGRIKAQLIKLKKAQADAETVMVAKVREGKAGWQGGAWWLERTKPDRYAQRQRIDISGTVAMLQQTSDRDMARLARQAAQTLGMDESTIELLPEEFQDMGAEEAGT